MESWHLAVFRGVPSRMRIRPSRLMGRRCWLSLLSTSQNLYGVIKTRMECDGLGRGNDLLTKGRAFTASNKNMNGPMPMPCWIWSANAISRVYYPLTLDRAMMVRTSYSTHCTKLLSTSDCDGDDRLRIWDGTAPAMAGAVVCGRCGRLLVNEALRGSARWTVWRSSPPSGGNSTVNV